MVKLYIALEHLHALGPLVMSFYLAYQSNKKGNLLYFAKINSNEKKRQLRLYFYVEQGQFLIVVVNLFEAGSYFSKLFLHGGRIVWQTKNC
ncbi:hypothetical protein CUU66_10785 [Peribacillus deserti]|uniref:Uncharacterized protein n=1 Tax=Peribacillus deserti TaxID=673318 RepID=A0A2N5M696_9BACI|nr:hypothetical protein CUU66_10785 [Peribacillus deserti]